LKYSSPFKGEVGRGMGESDRPIPTLALPLKGREAIFEMAAD
jgi:hypothetical protein